MRRRVDSLLPGPAVGVEKSAWVACVCARPPPTNPFFRERECVCVRTTRTAAGGGERESVRAPGEFVRAGESARECVRMRRVRRRRRHIIIRARAARRKRVAFIRAHPVAGVTTTAHCTRTSLAHTNTRHAHRQSARSRRHDRYTRVRPPPRTSYDSLFLSFTTFVVVVVVAVFFLISVFYYVLLFILKYIIL